MRYWWVNQKQTYRHEVPGGYLWSPKRKSNGSRNPYYEFMREVAPGDVVFSFADARIRAIGLITSYAYEAPKPLEFGLAGAYWEQIGWRVDVRFAELNVPMRPAGNMDVLAPLLPERYAPLRPNGRGLQNLYLTQLPEGLASELLGLIGPQAADIVNNRLLNERPLSTATVGRDEWEEHQIDEIRLDRSVPETTKRAIVMARRGQGLFKSRVLTIEQSCRITKVDRIEHLRASHCKPWRDASNDERLDGENGLLLSPNIDHLFDRGFISFESNGELLISPVAHRTSLHRLGLEVSVRTNVGTFSAGQKRYLEFHRDNVFLQSRLSPRRPRS